MTSQLKVDRISPATGSEIIIDGLEHRNKNLIINGAMTVSQRGETFDKTGYTLDRWYVGSSGYNISRGTAPHQFDYSLKCIRPTSDSHFIFQRIELDRIGKPGIFKQGEEFTVSCWVKGTAGAGFKASMAFSEGTGGGETRENWNGDSGDNLMTLTGGWDRYERTFSVDQPCNPSHNSVCLTLAYYGTAVNQSVWFTGVQVEKGSMATEFEHEFVSETLAKCQRYHENSHRTCYVGMVGGWINNGHGAIRSTISFNTLKRGQPTITYFYVPANWNAFTISRSNQGFVTELSTSTSTSDVRPGFHWVADMEL